MLNKLKEDMKKTGGQTVVLDGKSNKMNMKKNLNDQDDEDDEDAMDQQNYDDEED